jgi:hypothetical protein
MGHSHWDKLYRADIRASRERLFELTSDLPNYGRWLPPSGQYGATTEVEPYPVQLGTRYHDGKPTSKGRDWWGTVTVFEPPASLGFRQAIRVPEAFATVDADILYSFERNGDSTAVTRRLSLEIRMPVVTRPIRRLIISGFDTENLRALAALKTYAEADPE